MIIFFLIFKQEILKNQCFNEMVNQNFGLIKHNVKRSEEVASKYRMIFQVKYDSLGKKIAQKETQMEDLDDEFNSLISRLNIAKNEDQDKKDTFTQNQRI